MSKQDAGANAAKAFDELRALESKASTPTAKFLRHLLERTHGKQPDKVASLLRDERCADGVARENGNVHVNAKSLVMSVFLDADENCSISGYNERAANSFGAIYLGLDKGPEYERQSTKVNDAILGITRAEAFAVALQETRKALADAPEADELVVSDKVLAGICVRWFDLPDTVNVIEGPLRFDNIEPPPHCPGDYFFPSGHIFLPDPGESITKNGLACGRLLKQAVDSYVAGLRASQKLPEGVLSRAIFEAFPRGEDDLIARTIIGVMMGMLPTISYNLVTTITTWKEGEVFATLKEELRRHGGSDPFVRANDVLMKPLMEAMQGDPMPPAVWRTAVREHALGTNRPVTVHRGDKIHVNIDCATKEDLDAGVTDVFPVFGGDRRATPHPTHACPAYEAAIGIMLGVIFGMMEPI